MLKCVSSPPSLFLFPSCDFFFKSSATVIEEGQQAVVLEIHFPLSSLCSFFLPRGREIEVVVAEIPPSSLPIECFSF